MIISVKPGNLNKARESKDAIYGVGQDRSGRVLVEYEAGKDRPARGVLVINRGTDPLQVNHYCKATENTTPCWHLGMIALVLGITPPFDVEINNSLEPQAVVNDMTPGITGTVGDFQRLEFVEGDKEGTEDVEFIESVDLPPWMERYKLPWKLAKRVKAFRDAQEARLTDEQKSRIPEAKYIPSGQEVTKAVAALLYDGSWEAPLLIGPKGSGKSTLAETLATILMLPVNKVFGGIDLNAESLLGARTLVPSEDLDLVTEMKLRTACASAGMDPEPLIARLRGSQMKVGFDPGILLNAVERGEMVVIDEINMLIPEVTSLLHGLLDWQKILSVAGYGQVKAPESFRLIGAMNYGYAGTKPLNEAFQDRFRSVQVPHLSSALLSHLISDQTHCKRSTGDKLADVFERLSSGVANGDISERVLSIRSLFRAAREEDYGYDNLKAVAMSVLTEGLSDQFEKDQIRDIVDACIK